MHAQSFPLVASALSDLVKREVLSLGDGRKQPQQRTAGESFFQGA